MQKSCRRHIILMLLLNCSLISLQGQSLHRLLRQGDRQYRSENYPEATNSYQQAKEKEPSWQSAFNLGNALYQQEKYDEAIAQYQDAVRGSHDDKAKADAWYNAGNAHFMKKDYQKSIDAYKQALRLHPQDYEAKQNLALAKRMAPPPENNNQQQNQQNQQQQNQQDQQQQNQGDDQQQQQQDQPQQFQNDPKQERRQQPSPSRKEAEQMLQIMKEEERKTQERLRNDQVKSSRVPVKDW